MGDMDTLDSHTLMVDTDTHTLMEVTTILARDLPNHLPTTVMDMDVVMDMAVMAMAMVVKSYLQEAKGFYYLIFLKKHLIQISQISIILTKHFGSKFQVPLLTLEESQYSNCENCFVKILENKKNFYPKKKKKKKKKK